MNDRAGTLRERNMRKRRARILDEARGLLARGGPEAVNLRELARLAELTVPTIYNLIGNKEAVLLAVFAEVLAEVEARMRVGDRAEPLAMAEAVVVESTGLFAGNEDFYRSAFLAVEYLNQTASADEQVAHIYAWGERLTTAGVIACRKAGLLRGRIAPAQLGELILRSFRTSCRAWACGQLTLAAFRHAALTDVYITLAADAVETFHAQLVRKLALLDAAPAAAAARRQPRQGEQPS